MTNNLIEYAEECRKRVLDHVMQQMEREMSQRQHLPNRRFADTFSLEVNGLEYTCTVGRFPDGRIAEIFLSNHKSNSAADTAARDAAITFSIAVQYGADPETIRRALCRDGQGKAYGPLGVALDKIYETRKN